MPPTNSAAWLPAKGVTPLQVGPAPYTPPGDNEIVIKNAAIAINPVDWAKQLFGDQLLSFFKYPFVLGGDVAGEVFEVGARVTRFKSGDRVIGHALAGMEGSNRPAEGGFQLYTIVREHMVAIIPDFISFEQACVIPLGLSCATYGLFHKDFLALDPPTVPAAASNGKAVIITGGSTSVGSNAVQLAVSAGYEVFSTSSPKNFDYVRKLGASAVFDYNSASLANDLTAAVKASGKPVLGALAIGDGASEASMSVLRQCVTSDSGGRKFVALAGSTIMDGNKLRTGLGRIAFAGSVLFGTGRMMAKSSLSGVPVKFVDSKELLDPDVVVGRAVYRDFLPRALAARQFLPAPEPLVVGEGLDMVQEGMEVLKKGVSAKKAVVRLT